MIIKNLDGKVIFDGSDLRRAYLSEADLRSANLSEADLRSANLRGAYLSVANLRGAYLSLANLRGVYLSLADLSEADLRGADLSEADLRGANLSEADLRGADLRSANLSVANLRSANLSVANLRGANLRGANLSWADLPTVKDFLDKNFEKSGRGYIVYKTFGTYYPSPDNWEIKPNSIILSDVQEDRREACGYGINFATIDWITSDHLVTEENPIWKCKVYAKDVVVPLATDGKARASRLKILCKVDKL